MGDEKVELLRNYLRNRANWVTQKDSISRHQEKMEAIWQQALKISNGDVGEALSLCAEAVKSGPQRGELSRKDYDEQVAARPKDSATLKQQWERYHDRLNGIPTRAFGEPAAGPDDITDEDKPQHFFTMAKLAFKYGRDTSQLAGYVREFIDELKLYFGRDTGGWDSRDLVANKRGAEFGAALDVNKEFFSIDPMKIQIVNYLNGLEGPLLKKPPKNLEPGDYPLIKTKQHQARSTRLSGPPTMVGLSRPSNLHKLQQLAEETRRRSQKFWEESHDGILSHSSHSSIPKFPNISRPHPWEPPGIHHSQASSSLNISQPRSWEPFGIRHVGGQAAFDVRGRPSGSISRPPPLPTWNRPRTGYSFTTRDLRGPSNPDTTTWSSRRPGVTHIKFAGTEFTPHRFR